ncbi:MAG: cellulase family glycosylhydrolase [Chthoniobacteraceae bacterium]
MKRILLIVTLTLTNLLAAEPALQLHPENPHYFFWRGKPTVLITSGEHYGAVLNLDFDYGKYLQTLAKQGFNLTRTFTGAAYCEPEGAFKIAGNSLAPKKGRFLTAWARSEQPGAWDGGNKWDLRGWNEDYFTRFRDFVSLAAKHGVVVEVNLFCPFYEDKQTKQSKMWPLSPFNAANNINGLGTVPSHDVYTLDRHGGLLATQERFVKRIVEELKDFDNVYYEICNEPYFAGVTVEWQHHIADVIESAQKAHAAKKLISQNIANKSAKVTQPHSAVSIFNFHYTYPPTVVAENFALNKVIGENETGFRGTADEVYRNEAWDFLLAGGGLFNNLDYSFTAGHEDGTFLYPPSQPGGGGETFHAQLAVLVKFMNALDFVKMKPAHDIVRGLPEGASVQLVANPGREYAAYLHHSAKPGWKDSKKLNTGSFQDSFEIDAPAGKYRLEWIEPASGRLLADAERSHAGAALKLQSPAYAQDIALRIKAE